MPGMKITTPATIDHALQRAIARSSCKAAHSDLRSNNNSAANAAAKIRSFQVARERDKYQSIIAPPTILSSSAYTARFTSNCLISPIALAGFSPFGQVLVQFMMVWQR